MSLDSSKIVNRGRSNLLFFLAWMSVVTAICIGSLIPITNIPKGPILLSDKIQHGAAYFLVGILALCAAPTFRKRTGLWGFSFLIGIAIEFIQPLTGRHFEIADMFANGGGLLLSLAAFYLLGLQKKKYNNTPI